MINNPNYNKATNAAYEVLENYNGDFPQIDIFKIIKSLDNVKICTYFDISRKYCISVDKFERDISPSEYGFTIYDRVRHRYLICYNNLKSDTTIRFTIAHELGHIILEHEEDGEIEDKEANCFARNILCPVPLRNELNLLTTEDFCSTFEISPRAAQTVINLNSSDSYYITQNNYDSIISKALCYLMGYSINDLYHYC